MNKFRLVTMHRRWTVGELSAKLEIAAPTLRTWERRYGIGPTFRTAGGHRRYTVVDADRVATMARLIDAGVPARGAAERVKRMAAHEVALAVGTDDSGLMAGAVEEAIREILGGAAHFDGSRIQRAVEEAIERYGVGVAWDEVIGPAAARVEAQWTEQELGLAAERLVNLRILSAVRGLSHRHRVTGSSRLVLASIEPVQHHISLAVLSAALSEQGIASTELGARLPLGALEAFVRETDPRAVVVWAETEAPSGDLERVRTMGLERTVVLGGSGWPTEAGPDPSVAHIVERLRLDLRDELR